MAVEKVQSGRRLRIKARDWNQIADAANAFAAGQLGQAAGQGGRTRPGVVVPVHNASGQDRDRFDILGIGGAAFDPSTDLPAFQADVVAEGFTPTEPDHVGRFVILMEPAAMGAIAAGLIAGPCPVLLDVADGNHADFADIRDGDTNHLTTGPTGGAYVLWRAKQGASPSTGSQWGLVMLGPPAWPEKAIGDEYMIRQLRDIGGGVIRPVWDWARMHN